MRGVLLVARQSIGDHMAGKTRKSSKKIRMKKSKQKNIKFNQFTRILSVVYLFLLMVFEVSLMMMNVLPTKILVIVFVILALLSIVLFIQLYFDRSHKISKIFATVLSSLLMVAFCFGTVASFNTAAFIDKISSGKSDYAVAVTEKPFNIYISGMDYRGDIDKTEGRSDVNMVVTVNPRTHRILLTSFPRDYEVELSNHNGATDKLTHTGMYGIKVGEDAVSQLTGVKMNYYVKVNFTTIQKFIDAIGGVTVNSDVDFTSEVWEGGDSEGDKVVSRHHFVKGENHLDGQLALAFARERHAFEDGDNQRIKNQQAVFQAILEKMSSSTTLLNKYNSILGAVGDYMRTNMSEKEIQSIVKMQLDEMPSWYVEKYDAKGYDSYKTTYSGGSQELYVMEPDEDSLATARANIKTVMQDGYKKTDKNSSDSSDTEDTDVKITVKKHVSTKKK